MRNLMLRLTKHSILVLRLFSLLLLFQLIFQGVSVAYGLSPAPDFTLVDTDGNPFALNEFRGKVVLLDFMQTWCTHCIADVPNLIEVHDTMGDHFELISISLWEGDTDDLLRQFKNEYNTSWTYARGSELRNTYNITQTPTKFLIDSNGYIRNRYINEIDASTLIEDIEALLPATLTLTTSPLLETITFRVNGQDYVTVNGSVNIQLSRGIHQIELVDTMIEAGGVEYYFAQWNGSASGSNNPVQINFTVTSYLAALFDQYDTMSPSADAGLNQVVNEDTLVTLDGSPSTDNVGVTNYTWTFLDGSLQTLTGVAPTYTFATTGVYSVTLNVTDAAGNWATDTITITVLDASQLIVNAGLDQVVDEDIIVTLKASASWDPQGHATYIWTFLDETPQTLRGQTYNYTFLNPGDYTISLVVTDSSGDTATDTVQITVLDVTNPLAIMTMDHQLVAERGIHFSAANSNDNVNIVNYTWTFGDGNSTTGVNATHRYLAPGTYTITLSVTDAAGNAGTNQTMINVLENNGYFNVFTVIKDDQVAHIGIESCCQVRDFQYDFNTSTISFDVGEESDVMGYANISIPQDLLGTSHKILVDNLPVTPIETTNSTHAFLYIKYSHSEHAVTVVGTAGIMSLSGLSLVFSAGVLALFSPCGFPMLPGYLSYYLGKKKTIEKAVSSGIACTLGLMTVFSVIGAGVALLGSVITQYIPILELLAGSLAIVMGISMLTNIKFPTLFTINRAPTQKGLPGLFLYGIAYGLATLGCSAPIFFSTLFYALTSGGILAGIVTFAVYAIGMGLPILLITILLSKTKTQLLARVMHVMPWFQKISSLVIIAIGVYLISYYILLFA
jgi:cytochrome c biogenesis protein CcdA/cytochrome oxidase Cu insertion factor (SCO1/SenC/PrrC family)